MRVLAAALALTFALAGAVPGNAARTLEREALPAGDSLELIVFEVEGCSYCQLFRRDILPAYLHSPRAAEVPIRFVDLNLGTRGIVLDGPIEVVPTAVLVRANREAGRITGYAGRDSFLRMMRLLLGG